jgi:hypothetical protein
MVEKKSEHRPYLQLRRQDELSLFRLFIYAPLGFFRAGDLNTDYSTGQRS